MTERRIVNEKTGGAKGQKLARFDLMPPGALWALAEHYGRGAEKYADRNWELGYAWSLNFAAAQRHMWQWWNGEDEDEETGSSHLIAAMWHMAALHTFAETHPELDDRPTSDVADCYTASDVAEQRQTPDVTVRLHTADQRW